MIRRSAMRTALAMLAGLLGIIHLALTPMAYASWTIDALWFVGTGMAIIAVAAMNVIPGKAPGLGVRISLAAINIAMGGFFAAAWLVLPGPQVIIGGLLFVSLALFSLRNSADIGAPDKHPPFA